MANDFELKAAELAIINLRALKGGVPASEIARAALDAAAKAGASAESDDGKMSLVEGIAALRAITREHGVSLDGAAGRDDDHIVDANKMVPDGWKLVPIDPPIKMLNQIIGSVNFQSRELAKQLYARLLSAAPEKKD